MADAVFFETDVLGSYSNIKALASFIDVETGTTDFVLEVINAYAIEDSSDDDDMEGIIRDLESIAKDNGFTVVWNNGVFVYNTAEYESEEN